MAILDFLKRSVGVVVPLTPAEAAHAARVFEFHRTWRCGCGAQLKIRARENRSSGPSNFVAFPPGHPRVGHATLPSSALTWDGLAEERGWNVAPVMCPACKHGMDRAVYKDARRKGVI